MREVLVFGVKVLKVMKYIFWKAKGGYQRMKE
jgi:hypothetical protein